MKYFLFLVFLFSASSWSCEVTLPHNILVFGEGKSASSLILAHECDPKAISDLHETILSIDGRIASFQLEEMLKIKGHSIYVNPSSVLVQQLKSLIREQIILPPGVQARETRPVNNSAALSLANGDRVDVSCQTCLYGLQQPINVTIRSSDGTKQSHFASVDFKKMVKAYRITSATPSFSDIHPATIMESFVESIPHTDLVTDLESLKFYKTNKPLKAGDLLRRSDLNALNLVKAGLKTDVIMENAMVRIKTQGISRSNGAIGEFVEVFHQQKNKKYQGKVIDINKVLIEL